MQETTRNKRGGMEFRNNLGRHRPAHANTIFPVTIAHGTEDSDGDRHEIRDRSNQSGAGEV